MSTATIEIRALDRHAETIATFIERRPVLTDDLRDQIAAALSPAALTRIGGAR